MALQELSPLPPITGGSALAAAMMQPAATFAAQQYAANEAGKEREFRSTEAEKASARALANESELQNKRLVAASIQALINEGYLNGADRDKPEIVAEAYKRAQAAGLEKLYQEMLETPGDDGRPLLTVEEIADPAKVTTAKNKLGAIKAKQLQFSLGQRENAQATVDNIQSQLGQLRQRAAQIAASIDSTPPQYGPTDAAVVTLAQQMAEAAKPGSGRDREAVASMMPTALKDLNDRATMQHYMQQQSAGRELEALRYQEASLTAALREAMESFKVAPRGTATPSALQTPTRPAAPKPATADDIATAMRAVIGGGKPPSSAPAAPAPAGPAILDNPTNDPTIAAGNEAIKRRVTTQIQAQLNAAIRENEAIDRQLSTVRSGGTTLPAAAGTPLGLTPPSPFTGPIGAAQETADLLKKKAANEVKVKALQAQLMGPTPAAVSAPVANTATTSTPTLGAAAGVPEWWRTNATLEPVR